MSSEIEETIKRIQSQKGVIGVIIMDNIGSLPFESQLFISNF